MIQQTQTFAPGARKDHAFSPLNQTEAEKNWHPTANQFRYPPPTVGKISVQVRTGTVFISINVPDITGIQEQGTFQQPEQFKPVFYICL